jgi:hypothetical protein
MTSSADPALKYLQLVKELPQEMAIQYPIYIPSKGRAEIATTPRLLKDNNVPFVLMVEPQDKDKYLQHFTQDQICVMGENDKGITYARNSFPQQPKTQQIS